ncbi:hypothetical protein ACS0TY_031967 [Phlomoides rotata]
MSLMERWTPPPQGHLKINTDAASFSNGEAGLGFVIRSETGRVFCVGMKRIHVEGGSTFLEALALHFGLRAALMNNFSGLITETGSQILMRALRGRTTADS